MEVIVLSVDRSSNIARVALVVFGGTDEVPFEKKQLPWVRNYILNQKQHHASGQVHRQLERVSFDDDGSAMESPN